jgi:hypothetical protein
MGTIRKTVTKPVLVTQGLWGVLLMLVAPALALAKVAVPYGEDNGPKDSDTQAAADAFNDAIEGPDEGETVEQWETRLEDAYEALHHEEADFDDLLPHDYGSWNMCEVPAAGEDMCWSPVHSWLHVPSSDILVGEAIENASVHADLMDELQPFVHHMLRIMGAGGDVFVGSPTITVSCNVCNPSAAPLEVTVPFELISQQGLPGIHLGRGEVVAEADLWLQTVDGAEEWCLSFRSHDIQGLNFITLAAYEARIDMIFDSPICASWFSNEAFRR